MKEIFIAFCLLIVIFGCNTTENTESNSETVENPVQVLDNHYLDSLIGLDPKNPDLYYERSLANYNMGIFPAALTDIYSAISLDSAKAAYYYLGGDLFIEMGEGEKAILLMQKGISMMPEEEELYLRATEYNMYLGNHQSSLNFINDLLAINKYNADAYFLKGMVYKEIGDTSKAVSTFQTCVEQDPTFYNAYMQLGILLTGQKDELAVQYLENAFSLNENSREAIYGKAYFYQATEDYNQAIKIYKEMISVNPKDHEVFYNVGHCYLEMDSLEKAFGNFSIAIELQPSYAGAYYMRGFVSESAGDPAQALVDYKQAASMIPDNIAIQEAIERVQ